MSQKGEPSVSLEDSQEEILRQYEQNYERYQQQYQANGSAVGTSHFEWQEVFQMVLNPSPETFQDLVADSQANFRRALIWMGVGYSFIFIIAHILDLFVNINEDSVSIIGVPLGVPIAILFAPLLYICFTGTIHITALILGYAGLYKDFLYCFVVISIPITLASTLLELIPIIGWLLNVMLQLYASILIVRAISGLYKMSWFSAVILVYCTAICFGSCYGIFILVYG